jgi:mediator of RNA polymerase II transcription subunit 10
MIPMQVLLDIDSAKNPMLLTKDRLERAATENQFMNGKIAAIEVSPSSWILTRSLTPPQSYRSYLNEALVQSFPELAPHLTSHGMAEVKLESTLDVP